MKKTLLVALVAMALIGCKNEEKKADAVVEQNAVESVVSADFAYVNVDMVLAESDIFKSEGVALREKTEKTSQKWAKKEQNLQNEINQLAEKYQKGLITTRDAQAKEQELQKRAQQFQTSAQKEGKELEEENIVFQNRMNDLIMRAVEQVNEGKRFKMIIQASALLDADESLDISSEVLAKVNELYKEEKK